MVGSIFNNLKKILPVVHIQIQIIVISICSVLLEIQDCLSFSSHPTQVLPLWMNNTLLSLPFFTA